MKRKRTDLKIPYGVSDFRTIRNEGLYYIDKTRYLAKMEERDRFIFFVRPRRFGKSLFLSMMESYYDLNAKKDFKKLFGGLWLGDHPTGNSNRFMVLKLDFSKVGGTGESLERAFEEHLGKRLDDMVSRYPACFDAEFRATFMGQPASGKLADVVNKSRRAGIPLYLIIDEYDNFTNQMIRVTGVDDYREITHGAGFYRNWFKKFKGEFDRIFMTGVSPVDDGRPDERIQHRREPDARLGLQRRARALRGGGRADVFRLQGDGEVHGRRSGGDRPVDQALVRRLLLRRGEVLNRENSAESPMQRRFRAPRETGKMRSVVSSGWCITWLVKLGGWAACRCRFALTACRMSLAQGPAERMVRIANKEFG